MTAVQLANKQEGKADTYIIGIYITLCIISIVESFSASSREIAMADSIYLPMLKHLGLLAVGTMVVWAVQRIHFTKLVDLSMLFVVLTVVAMVGAMFFGDDVNEAQRAIRLPGFTVQPAEMAKIAVVFVLAFMLAQRKMRTGNGINNKGLVWCVGIVTAFGGILLMQGLTNAILFMAISFALLNIGGTGWKKLWSVIGIYIVIGLLFFAVKELIDEHRLEDLESSEQVVETQTGLRDATWTARIERWWQRVTGPPMYTYPITRKNEQEMYAYMAQANGGVTGVLPGNSRETSRLPLAFSDYVFSIVVEELGFVGGFALMLIYLCLLIRAGSIARKCSHAYSALLVMGMAVMVVLQALFHMAINVGVFPVSGQPLPLISKGGTSILVTCLAFGVMLSVSRSASQANVSQNIKSEKEALPESMRAVNPTKE